MAETKRTKADLITNLADNTSGAISPEDIRDVVESWDLSRGGYYWSAFGTTTLTLQGTSGPGGTNYYKIGGTTTARSLNRHTHSSPNRIDYTGTPTIRYNLWAVISFEVDTAGDIGLQVHKNGVAESASYQSIYAAANTRVQATIMLDGTLATSDYLEIFANHQGAAGAVLISVGGFVVLEEEPLN